MAPRVSIGLPTYNRARSLDRAIGSVLGQSHADLELVISDNCSTDATEEVCRGWAQRDPRVRYLRQRENIGVIANFNAVIAELRGELSMLVADDDWLDETYVESCVAELDLRPDHALVAGTSRLHPPDADAFMGQEIQLQEDDAGTRMRHFLATVMDNSVFYGVMRTQALQGAAPLHPVLGGDWILIAGVAFAGKVRTLPGTHINRSLGGTSSSVRHVLAVLGIVDGRRWRFPWAYTSATAFADIAWRAPVYRRLSRGGRLLLALRTAPSAIRWKGSAWQILAPPVLALRRRPRGRLVWQAFVWAGARVGDLPLHEVQERATEPRAGSAERAG